MAHLQVIIAALIVLLACSYIVRQVWRRLYSLVRTGPGTETSCASICGGCSHSASPTVLV